MPTIRSPSRRSIAAVVVAGLIAFVAIDLAIQRFSPNEPLREVADGMEELAALDTETVVLGSSHARTFHVLGQALAEAAPERPPLVAIPLEGGQLTGYAWILAHRVLPLIDARATSDRPGAIRRLVIVTEWWDSCRPRGGGASAWNLPSRAWTWSHYLADVGANGFTELNRNFLRSWVRTALPWSVTVQRRGSARILKDAARAVAGRTSLHTPATYATLLGQWQRMVEGGARCIGDPEQMGALEQMLATATARGLEATVVLFPRKPDTLTERGLQATIEPFRALAESVASRHGARFVDLTTRTPLRSEDFMDDFDHVSARGNRAFAQWALANDLAFLARAPSPRGAPQAAR